MVQPGSGLVESLVLDGEGSSEPGAGGRTEPAALNLGSSRGAGQKLRDSKTNPSSLCATWDMHGPSKNFMQPRREWNAHSDMVCEAAQMRRSDAARHGTAANLLLLPSCFISLLLQHLRILLIHERLR